MLQCLKSINISLCASNCTWGNVAGSAGHDISFSLAALPLLGSRRLNSMKRIGPHNLDILSLIIGSTLGDSHLEKRAGGIGTRVIFEQSNKNVEYLM
jgi:hypothetical protein